MDAETKYHTLVEQIPAAVYTDFIDDNEHHVYISPQITKIVRLFPEEWINDPPCGKISFILKTGKGYWKRTKEPTGPVISS